VLGDDPVEGPAVRLGVRLGRAAGLRTGPGLRPRRGGGGVARARAR